MLRLIAVALAAFLVAFLGATNAQAASDPRLLWKTIETKHFRVNFYSGEEEVARHVAALAESIHARLSPAIGWSPSERTEIALTDFTDSANGSAGALPYNAVNLYLTAPDDLSPLGDVDDWYLELVTHEYTHILHTDHIRGIPALVNRVLGKTLAPNQVQPRWILEGLATFEESHHTSGGRMRSSMWNMFLRADVLGNNVAGLDQVSNSARRWPQGNIWYLYGSFFIKWIAETYGDQAIRSLIKDYAGQLVPYGINRSIRRATGKTYEELYPAWIDAMFRLYSAQTAKVQARGIREGKRLTFSGQTAHKPRFIPQNAWAGAAGDILYFRDDAHSTGGLYRVPIKRDATGNVIEAREEDRELLIRTNGSPTASFRPDGGVVFSSNDVHRNLFSYEDLFAMAPGAKSVRGLEGNRTRLTDGFRADSPDVSPDGRRVVFVTNHRGTMYLQIADLGAEGITNLRTVVKSETRELAFAPRWSPDNVHIAYSVWKIGGYRDIRYVDTRDGSYVQVTQDRAIDGGPAFTPDGKWLLFHSDRTGIMNIYAWEIATGRLRQVTNVLTGAYQPEVSRDGKTIAYTGYTTAGFDIFAIRFDEAAFLDALPYVDTRPPMPIIPPPVDTPAKAYNPLETLRPRKYSVQITEGAWGRASILSVAGSDIAGQHGFGASITTEWEKPEPQVSLSYSYGRLPFDVGMHVYRSIAPRAGFQLGNNYKPTWVEETVGFESSIGVSRPRAFDGQSFYLSYGFARLGGELPTPADKFDPYETPSYPRRGLLGSVNVAWSYSNAERYLWSVAPEKGFSASINLSFADKIVASEFSGYAATFNFTTYQRMPWLRHHAIALHAGGGTGGGNMGGRGLFYVGGLTDLPLVDTVRNVLIQGGLALRGYPVVAQAGRSYALFNAEYRFPIVNIDHGPSTLPFFINRINGAVFADYGSAFDDAAVAKFKTGVGGELWFDATFGYIIQFTFRLGYAKGLASGGLDKPYFLAAVPF